MSYDRGMAQPSENTLPDVNWLTVAEVATYLRVSKMSVHRYIHNGSLPSTRVGRSFRINEDHVKEVLRGERELKSDPQ